MANTIFHLYQLQKLDSRMDFIKDRLAKISTILNSDSRIAAAENELKVKKELFGIQQKKLNDIEEAIHSRRMKIEQSEASLYGGGIKNPKELQDIQKEIASIKTSILALEDTQLEVMFAVETAEIAVTTAESGLESIKDMVAAEHSQLIEEKNVLEQDLRKATQARSAISGQITTDSNNLYEGLRIKKKGIAVTIIEDRCCSACGTELTPAEFQAAKSSGSLFYCSSCGRLLYAG